MKCAMSSGQQAVDSGQQDSKQQGSEQSETCSMQPRARNEQSEECIYLTVTATNNQ